MLLAYPTRHTEGVFFEMAEEAFEQPEWPDEVEPCLFVHKLVPRASEEETS